MGSCFAEHIGGWLLRHKMAGALNPFGVLFNPSSIAAGLERLSLETPYTVDALREREGIWCSFGHHGNFSGTDPREVLDGINKAWEQGAKVLGRAPYLLLTWGTAWVYEREGEVVANCHKWPAREFTRRRLEPEEIVSTYGGLIERWPDKKWILTVSPVIHKGDGLVDNQRSKAVLTLAAARLAEKYPEKVFYFPAYEIVTGELRDYRFYADDMCHPSASAIEYIRERFAGEVLSEDARELISEVGSLLKAAEHRPLLADDPKYQQFREKMLQKALGLQQKYKNADFTRELAFFG